MPGPRKPASPFYDFNASPKIIRLMMMIYVPSHGACGTSKTCWRAASTSAMPHEEEWYCHEIIHGVSACRYDRQAQDHGKSKTRLQGWRGFSIPPSMRPSIVRMLNIAGCAACARLRIQVRMVGSGR